MKKITTAEFIKKCIYYHGNKYDYTNTIYINQSTKICVKCNKCDSFFYPTPGNHIYNNHTGCPICSAKLRGFKSRKSIDEFKKEAIGIHADKYEYDLVIYKTTHTKVKIICKEHGIFEQTPKQHIIHKQGCPKCNKESKEKIKNNSLRIIERYKEIHGNKYEYSKVEYKGCHSKIEIICKKHGSFFMKSMKHLQGQGCSKCQESTGERVIRVFLESKNIEYTPEKTFDTCRDKNKLPFDFYLPKYNILIEFDGAQHYRNENNVFIGKNRLDYDCKKVRRHDSIKTKYAKDNNIFLLRIPYWKINSIPTLISKFLLEKEHKK